MQWEEKKQDIVVFEGKEYIYACKSYEVKENRGKRVELDDETDLAVFRVDGKLYCVSNICPHNLHPDIFEGIVENKTVSCPYHGWTFSIETGKHLQGGAVLKTYDILEKDGKVYIEKVEKKRPKWMQHQINE